MSRIIYGVCGLVFLAMYSAWLSAGVALAAALSG